MACSLAFRRAELDRGKAFHTSCYSFDTSRRKFIVDAIVDDVAAELDPSSKKQGQVFVGTGQYSTSKDAERLVVISKAASQAGIAAGPRKVLFDGQLASDDIDALEERLSKLNCMLQLGEVDALRNHKANLAFTRAPDVTVFALDSYSPVDPGLQLAQVQDSIMYNAIVANSNICSVGDGASHATGVPSKMSTISLASVTNIRVYLEEVEWAFAELQVRLTSGEVVTLLRTDLGSAMDDLIDIESGDDDGASSPVSDMPAATKTGNDCSQGGVQRNESPTRGGNEGHSLNAIPSDADNILEDASEEADVGAFDFTAGKVEPELAIVMATEWMVKLAAQLCLSCHHRKYRIGLQLPAVLRPDCNKWVELRNQEWMASRRSPT